MKDLSLEAATSHMRRPLWCIRELEMIDMEKEEKELEKEKLQEFKDNNSSSTANKNKAREIKGNIGTFIEIDRFNLKHSKSYFDANKSARIDLDDAIEHFENYIDSKLKKKDDWHFHEGVDKLSLGISEVITLLSKD